MSTLLEAMAFGVILGTLAIAGCGKVVEAAPSTVSGVLSIMPTPATLTQDQTINLAAIITTEPDTIEDVTRTAIWESSSTGGLIVTNGKATCKHAGVYKVTASTLALTQSATITCKAGPLPIQPPTPPTVPTPPNTTPISSAELTNVAILNAPSIVRSNVPYSLSARGTYADSSTSDVTKAVSWKGDSVASVSSTGVIYCNAAGKAIVTATIGAHTSSAELQCFMKQITGNPGFVEHSAKFYGPFPSWLNAKDFGAKGDGITDDTQALQSAISAAASMFKTLWVPQGVYKISNTLRVLKADGISIIGEDLRTTKIIWRGAAGGTMITFDGSTHFRISRIGWDCQDKMAAVGLHIGSTLKDGQLYPTYDAIEDLEFRQCGTGISPQFAGETTINRVHFDQNSFGINLGDWNALNFNVTDSLFTDNNVGVSNSAVAGAFNVSNSVFVRSKLHDMEMGNTSAFAIRHNLSVGSNMFFSAGFIVSNAAVTLEGNVIVDTLDVPVVYGNQGTVSMIDNTFDMPSNPQRRIFSAVSSFPTFVFSVGNSFTTATPYEAIGGSTINLTSVDEAPLTTMPASNWAVPTEVYVPPASTAPVIEVQAGTTSDVQSAINDAAKVSGGATVHIPDSSYLFNITVEVPDVPGLAIIGDGQNTDLRPGPMLLGPVLRSHGSVELDSFFVSGSAVNSSIEVKVPDEPSTRILCDSCTTVNTPQSILVLGLDHAMINTRTSTLNGNKGVTLMGGANQANGKETLGRMDAFMTVSDTFTISNGGHFLISDGWHDGGQSPIQAVVSEKSTVTEQGSSICVASPTGVKALGFTGQLSLVGDQVNTAVFADAASTGTLGMIGSITGSWWPDGAPSTQLAIAGSGLKVIHGGDSTTDRYSQVGAITNTPAVPLEVEHALSQSRTEFVIPREPLATSATLVRIHRVMAGDGVVGMTFSSSQKTPSSSTYSIADPTNQSFSSSCSTGTLSLEGSWSLTPGGDGFYGLLRSGMYLASTIDAVNGDKSLGTTASMTDAGQRWLVQATGNGLFRLINRADGGFLTRTSSGCATVNTANEGATQEWAIATK